MKPVVLESLIESAINFRAELFDEKHEAAFRLFNGFTEGKPNLVVDLYGKTLVIHNYAEQADQGFSSVLTAQNFIPTKLPWIQAKH